MLTPPDRPTEAVEQQAAEGSAPGNAVADELFDEAGSIDPALEGEIPKPMDSDNSNVEMQDEGTTIADESDAEQLELSLAEAPQKLAPSVPALAAAEQASLVFRGKVVSVEYGFMKQKVGEHVREDFPYSKVTFQVLALLRGTHPESTITLRFPGGPAKGGGALLVSGQPIFNVQDEGYLFVGEVGAFAQLAGPALLPVVGQRVFSMDGHLLIKSGAQIVLGPEESISQLDRRRVGDLVFVTNRDKRTAGDNGIKDFKADFLRGIKTPAVPRSNRGQGAGTAFVGTSELEEAIRALPASGSNNAVPQSLESEDVVDMTPVVVSAGPGK